MSSALLRRTVARAPRGESFDRWTAPIALGLLAVLVYANGLANGFVLDDRGIILENPLVREPATAWRAFLMPYWPTSVGGGQYRPLGILSFALDQLVAGPSAAWYHAVNIAWHATATLLFWYWIRGFLAAAGALAAAALFAVHPVHVEAVANLVGRLELMAAALIFAALIAHRRQSWFAPVLYACALLSKEHSVVFVALALLSHAVEPRGIEGVRARRALWVAYGVVPVTWLCLMLFVVRNDPPVTSAVFQGLATQHRLLTVVSIVPEYLRLLVVPIHLSADYEPGVIQPMMRLSASVLLGAAVLIAWLWAVVRVWRADRVVAFAMIAVPTALAPVSNVFFATGVALAERTLYLASAGICVLAGRLLDTAGSRRGAMAVVALLLVVLGGFRTWSRTPVWRDARTFALTLLEDHPESYRGHWVAGRVLLAAGDLAAAQREFVIARRIFPGDSVLNREAAGVDSTIHARAPLGVPTAAP